MSVEEIVANNYSLDFCGFPNEEKVILSPKETIENFKAERQRLDREMDAKLQEIINMLGV